MSGLKSYLGRFQATEMDRERIKSEAWNEEGILVIRLDDPELHWAEREAVRAIGNKKYGNPTTKGKR